jgi:hypothetical protein
MEFVSTLTQRCQRRQHRMESKLSGTPQALLRRIQQDNQRLVLGKLLHDLRNPVHSLRISMELFGRLARREGDLDKLIARAASYIGPAEAALESLVASCARLATYLNIQPEPVVTAVSPHQVFADVALLVRGSRRQLKLECMPPEVGPALRICTDGTWLSHIVLHTCLCTSSQQVTLSAGEEPGAWASIHVQFAAAEPQESTPGPGAQPLTADELRGLVETAAGGLERFDEGGVVLRFMRQPWPDPAAGSPT